MTAYTLTVRNESSYEGTMVLYQALPDFRANLGSASLRQPRPAVFTLAWKTAPCAPDSTSTFTWEDTYDYVLCMSLESPVDFQQLLSTQNTIPYQPPPNNLRAELAYDGNTKAYKLQAGAPLDLDEGVLQIVMTDSVPPADANPLAAVGIGMDGVATHVTKAQRNFTCVFTPVHPPHCFLYFAFFGGPQSGQVLNLEEIKGSALEVPYTDLITDYTATLTSGNEWRLEAKTGG